MNVTLMIAVAAALLASPERASTAVYPSLENQRTAAAVRSVELSWTKAFMCGDTVSLRRLLASDYSSTSGTGRVTGLATELARAVAFARAHPCTVKTVYPQPPTSVRVRGTTAIVTYQTPHAAVSAARWVRERSVDVFYYSLGAWHAWYSQHTPELV